MNSSASRVSWQTRFGFYFAAIGSAFGLGNLWRFPYIVSENGGGAFVLLYVFLAFFVGAPILVGELLLGKVTKKGLLASSKWLGRLSMLTCLIVLSYYAVISGWVLHFFMRFLVDILGGVSFQPDLALSALRENTGLQVALASAHLLVVIVIVAKGLQNGIEKWIGYVMSIFAILLMVLVVKSLSLPSAGMALRFLFYPDFSKLNLGSFAQALGHVLFTLSLGFGMMVTFGSYLKKKAFVPEAGFRVAILDTALSLGAGLLVFPILLSATLPSEGPNVLFSTIPRLFGPEELGRFFGLAFFLCLYLSSLGASLGMLESIVSNLEDSTPLSRVKAGWIVGAICLFAAVLPTLPTASLSSYPIGERGILETLDGFLINWILPIIAIGICWLVTRKVTDETGRAEFDSVRNFEFTELYGGWRWIVRWMAPALILLALLMQMISVF